MEHQPPGGEYCKSLAPPSAPSRDDRTIQLGIEAARAEDREVDDASYASGLPPWLDERRHSTAA